MRKISNKKVTENHSHFFQLFICLCSQNCTERNCKTGRSKIL